MARAAYADSEVVLLDDCLSAVDAHTGKALLNDCLLTGPMANKTRILVTHTLHVLDKVDYIYVMDEGKIVEQGTFTVHATSSWKRGLNLIFLFRSFETMALYLVD
jgi:ATP-binding cassette, subfamily C (CFTR/MRP), member 1